MIGTVGRRLVESTVGLFALLGFLYVPLGRHTGFEHARSVLSTPQARAAIEDVASAAVSLRERALGLLTGAGPAPAPSAGAQHRKRPGPSPVPPALK